MGFVFSSSIRRQQRARRFLATLTTIAALLSSSSTFAQPNLSSDAPYAASGEQTAQRLKDEQENKYRVDIKNGTGGAETNGEVLMNMQKLFKKFYLDYMNDAKATALLADPPVNPMGMGARKDFDKWFSPHLRDTTASDAAKIWFNQLRSKAGAYNWPAGLFTSCDGACWGCRWIDEHFENECCGVATFIYEPRILPSNFKACCVREGEEEWSLEKIACTHLDGTGWAGLFEYYYPATAVGWEPQRLTSKIATRQEIQDCVKDTDRFMERADGQQQLKNWVKDAVARNLRSVGHGPDGSMDNAIADAIKNVKPKEEKLRYSDSVQGGGLTMRPNFAHMDPAERRAIATDLCMHPDQFGKLMDPGAGDYTQRGGGPDLADLEQIPVWANYCPEAVRLMTNPEETVRVMNFDFTPTNFQLGMAAFAADPLYCQKMHVARNPLGGEFLLNGALKGKGLSLMPEEAVGYTCRPGNPQTGGFSTRMVPVELHSTAKIDPRTLDHAIPFMIAGGYYLGGMYDGLSSFYKRFEPIKYFKFQGDRWKGEGPNEREKLCRSVGGEDYSGGEKQPDHLYISDVDHKPFTDEKLDKFNQYDREWAKSDEGKNFHNRGFDASTTNYATAFRPFATCPKGYARWRGPHSNEFAGACGEENFGGSNRGMNIR